MATRKTTAVLELDLTQPFLQPAHLQSSTSDVRVLCRLHGRPVGVVQAPVTAGRLSYRQIVRELLETRVRELAIPLVERAIATNRRPCWPDAASLLACNPEKKLDGTIADIVFVEGSSALDPDWISAATRIFLADPEVMVVTPAAGFHREWAREQGRPAVVPNMAVWRSLLDDPDQRYTAVSEPSALAWRERVLDGRASDAPRAANRRTIEAREVTRQVDLAVPLRPIADASGAEQLRLIVSWDGMPIGSALVRHGGAIVSPLWITDAIASQLTAEVLDVQTQLGPTVFWSTLTASLARELVPKAAAADRRTAATSESAPLRIASAA